MSNRDPNWWTKSIIYELYVDKFAGDFKGLVDKLDYFNHLGVDTLWLLPHYPSPMVDGGYDISDYCSIHPQLGTLEDFDAFLSAAHTRGLKVIIDLVLNHTSDQHEWFKQARSSKDNPKRHWYMWSDTQDRFPDAFVHFEAFKGKNWISNPQTNDFYYATFYPQQPDLNWDNPEVFSAMMSVVDFWLGRGVDGFRLDAVARLVKRDATHCFALPETHEILKRIRKHIESKFPNILLMAETGGWPDEAKGFFASGDECQVVLNFPLAVQLLSAIGNHDLSGVQNVWDQSCGIPDSCRWGVFLTNHDSVDVFFLTSEEKKRELIHRGNPEGRYSLEPDGSYGARLAQVCAGKKEDIVWATRQLLTLPAVPVLYYGNEIGMPNANLSEKPEDPRLFVRQNFDWEEAARQQSDPDSFLNQIRQLIVERKNSS